MRTIVQVMNEVSATPMVRAVTAATIGSRPVGDPRRRESGIGDEQDPNHDRSHERQDPQEAHHATRLRVVVPSTDLPDVPRAAGR